MAGRYDKSTETTNLLPRACLWLWSSTSGQGLIVARIRHVQNFLWRVERRHWPASYLSASPTRYNLSLTALSVREKKTCLWGHTMLNGQLLAYFSYLWVAKSAHWQGSSLLLNYKRKCSAIESQSTYLFLMLWTIERREKNCFDACGTWSRYLKNSDVSSYVPRGEYLQVTASNQTYTPTEGVK